MEGNVFTNVITWIATNVIQNPALLLGIVAWIGLLLQKKDFSATVQGTLKTIVGYLILQQGSSVLVGSIQQLAPIMETAFGVKAAGLSGPMLDTFIANYAGYAAIIMMGGFILNLILARLTPLKFVYLTGHLMYWIALLFLAVALEVNPATPISTLLILGSIFTGLYWTLQPALTQPFMRKIMGMNEIALGHTSASNDWLAGVFGKFVGKPEDSTEKLKVPKWMGFLRDVTAGSAFLICVLLVLLALIGIFMGKVETNAATYVLDAFKAGLTFAMGITVLLFGVRMVIAEIVPAFRGFAQKVVPDAKPALDCPVIFDYAPTAVIVGFVSTTIAFLLLMILFGPILKWTTIVPPFIMLFFVGGAGAVFGNATGGFKGAVLGGVIAGVLLAIGQAIVTPMLATTAPELSLIQDPDWMIIVLILKPLLSLFL